MDGLTIRIYGSNEQLPEGLMEDNFFHSPTLFMISRQTPRHRPYMVTVKQNDGRIVAQMLALVRYRASLLPPYFYMHCRILGEGAYHPDHQADRSGLFGLMLGAIKERLSRRVLYIEVSNLSQKMFAYREFRQNGFFPVRWMSIHNSLHSMPPADRLPEQVRKDIGNAYQRGVQTCEVATEDEFRSFARLLRRHNWMKPRRYVPHDDFFRGITESGHGRLFVTKYKGHVVGCSAVGYSQRQAYLWYSAFRRKSFAFLHPGYVTIWHAIEDAYKRGFEHIYFMDVGLPYSKNPFRDFILSFGGKPVSTYRWFHCPIGWINALLSWFYRD